MTSKKISVTFLFLLLSTAVFFFTIARASVIDDSNPPVLQSFTSTPSTGSFGPGSVIDVYANFDEDLAGGSYMSVTLDAGPGLALDQSNSNGCSVSTTQLCGAYTIGSGQNSSDLTINSIDAANITDMDSSPNNSSNYSIPGGQNLGDTSSVVVDTTAPALTSADIDGTTLTLTYDKTLDTGSVPNTTDFVVNVNSSPVTVSSVNVTGTTVVLGLSAPIAFSDAVTVDYSAGGTPIRDTLGNDASSLSGQGVTTDTTAPSLTSADVDAFGSTLTLTYSEPLDTGSVPSAGDFMVTVNGLSRSVTNVDVSGSTVALTLSSPVLSSDAVSVSYTVPGSGSIRDVSSNNADALLNQSVTNLADDTAPALVSFTSGTSNGTYTTGQDINITANFDENISGTSTMTVLLDTGVSVELSTVSGNTLSGIYTVASGQHSLNLTISSITNSSISDLYGNTDASYSVPATPNNLGDTNKIVIGKMISVGINPNYLLAVGTKIYVSNFGTTTVSVIDSKTDTVITTINNLSAHPSNMYLVGRYIYLISDGKLSIIDTQTDTIHQTLTLSSVGGGASRAYVLGMKLYVTANTRVYVINMINNTLEATITTGSNAAYDLLAVGQKLYVGSQPNSNQLGGGNVSVIDINPLDVTYNTVLKSIHTDGTPYSLLNLGSNIYVAEYAQRAEVISALTDTIIDTLSSGTNSSYYLSTVGNYLYLVDYNSGSISVYNANNDAYIRDISTGGFYLSSVGSTLYGANSANNSISVIDAISNTFDKSVTVGQDPVFTASVGKKIYVADRDSNSVSVIDADSNILLNIDTPHLLSITSTSADGTYTNGQSVNITANFNEALGAGSKMRVTLNTGATVDLSSVSGSTLSGTYIVGAGDATPDLSVSSISNDSAYTSVSDTSSPANTQTSFDVPASPELTGDASQNLGDLKNISIGNNDYIEIPVGTNPYQMATVGSVVYVANQGTDNVSVVDTSTNTIITTISVGSQPYGVAYNSTSKEVYVANLKGNSVSVIDANPLSGTYNTLTHTITSGMGVEPYYVASLGSKIYVTNNLTWTVSVIDTTSHTVTNTVNVGANPRGIKAHGTDLYVANFGSSYGGEARGTVSVINTATTTPYVTQTIAVGSGARGVAVSGNEVYVTNFNDGTVSVINTGNNTVTNTISVGKEPRGVLVLGSNIYVENFADGTISVIDTGTHTVTATIAVGNTPAGMTAVGTDIYLSRFTDGVVSILDTTDNVLKAVANTNNGGGNSNPPADSQPYPGAQTGGGSGGSVTIIYPTVTGTGCIPGYLFSTTTGKPCSETTSGSSPSSSSANPVVTAPSTPAANISVKALAGLTTDQKDAYIKTSLGDYQFPRVINLGYSSGTDVALLQRFLNLEGFTVSLSGPGSFGNESNVFGAKTKAALILFQKARGINPPSGFFGPITRGYVNAVLK